MTMTIDDFQGKWKILAGDVVANIDISSDGGYHMSFFDPRPNRNEIVSTQAGRCSISSFENSSYTLTFEIDEAFPAIIYDKVGWPREGESCYKIHVVDIGYGHFTLSSFYVDTQFCGLMARRFPQKKIAASVQPIEAPSLSSAAEPGGSAHKARADAAPTREAGPSAGTPPSAPRPDAPADASPAPERSREAIEQERKEVMAQAEIQKAQAALEIERIKAEAARKDQEFERSKQQRLLDIERQKKALAEQNEVARIKAQIQADNAANILKIQQMNAAAEAQSWQIHQDMINQKREAMNKTNEAYLKTLTRRY